MTIQKILRRILINSMMTNSLAEGGGGIPNIFEKKIEKIINNSHNIPEGGDGILNIFEI